MGEIEGPSTEHQRPGRFPRLAKELGGRRRDPEDHVGSRQPVVGVASGVPRQEPLAAVPMGASAPSLGPLINPSSETASPVRTFPMLVLLPQWSARSQRTPTWASSEGSHWRAGLPDRCRKPYPPGSVIRAVACRPSHGDDGFPLGGPLADIPGTPEWTTSADAVYRRWRVDNFGRTLQARRVRRYRRSRRISMGRRLP